MAELLCPADGTVLRHLERSGVEIDACPTCRGVWLDRGELDKILERERADFDDFEREIRGEADRERGGGTHGKPRKKKRSSFLEEFLDFG
jgi:uncharacterized protein